MAQQLKAPVVEQVKDVRAPSGKEVVETDYFLTIGDQTIAQMRANKTRATGYQYSHLTSSLKTCQRNNRAAEVHQNRALARPSGRVPCVTFLEPSLTVGLMPRHSNIVLTHYGSLRVCGSFIV